MPEYGLLPADQGRGLLPWGWAQQRLENSRNFWVATTRPDGRPHLTAVWGVWWDNALYFGTGRLTRKARNLAQNPNCVVCTEDTAESVIVEGVAQPVSDSKVLQPITEAYRVKYGVAIPDDSIVYAVHPKVAFGFIENEAEFAGSATRWHFSHG